LRYSSSKPGANRFGLVRVKLRNAGSRFVDALYDLDRLIDRPARLALTITAVLSIILHDLERLPHRAGDHVASHGFRFLHRMALGEGQVNKALHQNSFEFFDLSFEFFSRLCHMDLPLPLKFTGALRRMQHTCWIHQGR
jgi:hypothetical protein